MTQLPPSDTSQMPQHLYGIVPKQKKGLAVAGLVLGVLSVVSFYFACVSVVLAVVGLVLSAKAIKRKTARGIAITGLVASLLGLLLVIAFVAFVTVGWNNKGVWNGIGTCGSRIYSIGRAVEIYRAENADQYPPNLEALIQDHAFYYGRELPRCPLDGSSEGTSYFYCAPWNGPNAQEGAPATNCIIACEVMAAHPVTGFFGPDESNKRRHILWSDGTIELYTESEFQQELQQPENRRFAREFAKGIQMTPQERVTYIAPRDGE